MPLQGWKIGDWINPIVKEADKPGRSAAEMKAIFDSNSNQLKEALNGLIDSLAAQSASGGLGSAQVAADVPAGSILSQLQALRAILDERVQTVEIGTVETVDPSAPAVVTITGELPRVVLNFQLPQGYQGDPTNNHATTHAIGGNDPVTPGGIGAADLMHAAQHGASGADPVTPAAIGAAAAGHTHAQAEVAGLPAALNGKAATAKYTVTLPTTGWVTGTGQYTRALSVPGILATDDPIICPVWSAVAATRQAQLAAWGYVDAIFTSANAITVYAAVVPGTALPLQIQVVR